MSDTFLSRLLAEKEALDSKLESLTKFMNTDTFLDPEQVSDVQVKLLTKQQNVMENYSDILSQRIDDLTKDIEVDSKEFNLEEE